MLGAWKDILEPASCLACLLHPGVGAKNKGIWMDKKRKECFSRRTGVLACCKAWQQQCKQFYRIHPNGNDPVGNWEWQDMKCLGRSACCRCSRSLQSVNNPVSCTGREFTPCCRGQERGELVRGGCEPQDNVSSLGWGSSLRSSQILVDRRNVWISCLVAHLL